MRSASQGGWGRASRNRIASLPCLGATSPPGPGSRGGFAVVGSVGPFSPFPDARGRTAGFPRTPAGPHLEVVSVGAVWLVRSPSPSPAAPSCFYIPAEGAPSPSGLPLATAHPALSLLETQRPDPKADRQFRARRGAWTVVMPRAIAWVPWSRAPRWLRRSCCQNLASGERQDSQVFWVSAGV